MALNLIELTDDVRGLMLSEVATDIAANRLYKSKRFSSNGLEMYEDLLREAILHGDDDTLARELVRIGAFLEYETRKTKTGTTQVRVPETAPFTFAEGEFNRFYIRGLCLKALVSGVDKVTIYRARAASSPRPESEALIGRELNCTQLLEDLRVNSGVETALGLAQPNSGVSVRI